MLLIKAIMYIFYSSEPAQSEEYPFVEEPSQEFYCPVMYDLLLQPHRTSCCGNNLSKIAVKRIKGAKGRCPLCRAHRWSTNLDTEFQMKVQALPVFCPHVDRGCKWKGELHAFKHHVQSCSKAPQSTKYVFFQNQALVR